MSAQSPPNPAVYGVVRGRRARWASLLAARARRRRHTRFFPLTGATAATRIVDVGCASLGLRALEPELDITGVDVVPRPEYPARFVQADPTEGLPFEDRAFDLAYCNSVIEHVAPESRAAFARELKRVARGWLVQTPAWSFPIEPHALLPGAHWLPPRMRRRYWPLGVAGDWEDISLLRRGEMADLFGPPLAERFGPLVKSWVSIKPIDT